MEKIDLLLLLDYFNTHPLSARKYSGLCFVLLELGVGKIDNYCYKTYFMTARVTMAEPLTFACFQLSSSKYGMLYPWLAPSQPWYMFCDAPLF